MPLRVPAAILALFFIGTRLVAQDDIEPRLKALVEEAGRTGDPAGFVDFRKTTEAAPTATPETRKLLARYADEVDAALAARPVRVLRVKVGGSAQIQESVGMSIRPVPSPAVRDLSAAVAALQAALIEAAKDNGVCELQFRAAFGKKEAAATWKTLQATVVETYSEYRAPRAGTGRKPEALPRRMEVALAFGDRCVDAYNSWSHQITVTPQGILVGDRNDFAGVAVPLPQELDQDDFAKTRQRLHDELLQQFVAAVASLPKLAFFPGIDRAKLAVRNPDGKPADDMHLKALALFEPGRYRTEMEAFWPAATLAEVEQLARAMVEINDVSAAPHLIERLPQFSDKALETLAQGLLANPGYANNTLILAIFRQPEYKRSRWAWNHLLRLPPKSVDLKKEFQPRVRDYTDPNWNDTLEFYLGFVDKDINQFNDLLLPPTDPKLSEAYMKFYARRVDQKALTDLCENNYLQLDPPVREMILALLKDKSLFRPALDLEQSRKALEKGDARTPEDLALLHRNSPKYATVRKALRAAKLPINHISP